MTNLNENEKSFGLNDEVLDNVSGGTELSDFIKQIWIEEYGQPDGSFKFVCQECGKVITGWVVEQFFDDVNAHISSHLPEIHIDDNIPLPPNPDYL